MSADAARAEREKAASEHYYNAGWDAHAAWQASRPFTEEDVEIVAKRMADAASDWLHSNCGDDDHWIEHSNWEAYTDDARAALDAVTARHTKGDGA